MPPERGHTNNNYYAEPLYIATMYALNANITYFNFNPNPIANPNS